jgi:hypothetical protein
MIQVPLRIKSMIRFINQQNHKKNLIFWKHEKVGDRTTMKDYEYHFNTNQFIVTHI